MAEQLLCGEAGQGSERRCWGLARVKVKGPLKMVSADSVGEFEKGGWVIRLPQHMLGTRKAPGWGQSGMGLILAEVELRLWEQLHL